jgi:hypothetical protein
VAQEGWADVSEAFPDLAQLVPGLGGEPIVEPPDVERARVFLEPAIPPRRRAPARTTDLPNSPP